MTLVILGLIAVTVASFVVCIPAISRAVDAAIDRHVTIALNLDYLTDDASEVDL